MQRHSSTIIITTTDYRRLERYGLRDIFPFDRDAAVVVSVDQRKKVSKNIIHMRLGHKNKSKGEGGVGTIQKKKKSEASKRIKRTLARLVTEWNSWRR